MVETVWWSRHAVLDSRIWLRRVEYNVTLFSVNHCCRCSLIWLGSSLTMDNSALRGFLGVLFGASCVYAAESPHFEFSTETREYIHHSHHYVFVIHIYYFLWLTAMLFRCRNRIFIYNWTMLLWHSSCSLCYCLLCYIPSPQLKLWVIEFWAYQMHCRPSFVSYSLVGILNNSCFFSFIFLYCKSN